MSTDNPVRVAYRGPVPLASTLLAYLQQEGATVAWGNPPAQHWGPATMDVIETQLVVMASARPPAINMVRAAVARFREHFPGEAEVEIEGDDHVDQD